MRIEYTDERRGIVTLTLEIDTKAGTFTGSEHTERGRTVDLHGTWVLDHNAGSYVLRHAADPAVCHVVKLVEGGKAHVCKRTDRVVGTGTVTL